MRWFSRVTAASLSVAGLLLAQESETFASAAGMRVAVPNGWHWDKSIADKGGPLALRNFNRYESGGIVPSGGAEIDLTRVPAPRNLSNYIQQELSGAQSDAPVESAIQNHPAVEVTFIDTYGDLKLNNRAIYILDGSKLYKIYLTFRAGEPDEKHYVATFQQLARQASLP